jgi:fucose 4-O-acetylase-like acetyltransferase
MRLTVERGERTSDAIRIARVIGILSLVYVHSRPYETDMAAVPHALYTIMEFVRLTLGRNSVPLLSIISGYLLMQILERRRFSSEFKKKWRTLIVPLFLWNAITLIKDLALDKAGARPTLLQLPDALLALTGYPANLPTYFLRDIFLCFLVYPVFGILGMRGKIAFVVAWLVLPFVLPWSPFLNPAIPVFFFLGCLVHLGSDTVDVTAIGWRAMALAALVLVGCAVATIGREDYLAVTGAGARLGTALTLTSRAAGAVFYWALALALQRRALGARLRELEPAIFFIFCAHSLALGLSWLVLRATGLAASPTMVGLYFATAPVHVLIICLAALAMLARFAPRLLGILVGGRAPSFATIVRLVSRRSPQAAQA